MGSYGLDQAGKFGNKILDAIMKPINFVGDMVGAALDGVVTAFKATWNAIAGVWNASIGKFEVKIPGWVPKWGGKGWEMPDLPKFADGGIVTGPTVGLIGEAGPEAVIPLSKMGAMGTTNITINMPAGADGNDVVLALQNYVRQHGSIPLATNNLVRV
jgi:phage-related minor tail protein